MMFIALRDLRFAKGRFGLVGSVIALMTFMVVMLTGLTAGLGAASVSAINALPVDRIAFAQPADGQDVSFTTSTLPPDTGQRLATKPGVTAAHPIGIATGQLRAGANTEAVSMFGTDPDLYPTRESGQPPGPAQVAIGTTLADDAHLKPGDQIELTGQRLTVAAIVDDTSFNHLPVVYTSIDTWQRITRSDTITAVGLRLNGASAASLAAATDLHVLDKDAAFAAVGAYSSEQGSLNLMRGLLIAVSVLIVGSFFTVWTMQRAGDLAVVRAIGGSRGYLLRDALGQATLVLLAGAAAGGAVASAAGIFAAAVVPFQLTAGNVLVPVAAMIGVGLLGAVASVRRVTTVDPLTALGAAR
ncbi:MAG: ABC transporter permease [Jatrophihabitans sp.]